MPLIRFQLRRRTAAEFASLNEVLLQGEEGYELDTGKRKVGDGVTAWNSLPYNGAALGAALTALNALTPAANKLPYFTGSTTASLTDFPSFGRTIVASTDAAALTTLPNVFTPTLKGLVPSGGSDTTFLRGDGTWQSAGGDNTAWASYTPVVTSPVGTINSYSATGAFKQIGKTVFFRVTVIINDAGTSSGFNIFTLPVTARGAAVGGPFTGSEENITGKLLSSYIISTTTAQWRYADGSFAGGNNVNIYIAGIYEAA